MSISEQQFKRSMMSILGMDAARREHKTRRQADKLLKKQLAIGANIEMEHVPTFRKLDVRHVLYTDKEIAKMIAQDHLKEHPLYYKYLVKMEKQLKKMKK